MFIIPLQPLWIAAFSFALGASLYTNIFELLPFASNFAPAKLKLIKITGAVIMVLSVIFLILYAYYSHKPTAA